MTAKTKVKPFKPVSIAQQRKQHHLAVVAAAKKSAVAPAVRHQRHIAALKAAKARKAKHAKKHGAPLCADDVACCVAEAVSLLTGQDPLELYWRTASDPGEGATVPDTLEAAGYPDLGAALILGLELPGGQRHAVLELGGVWWSWGEPYEPWPAIITEEWTWRP